MSEIENKAAEAEAAKAAELTKEQEAAKSKAEKAEAAKLAKEEAAQKAKDEAEAAKAAETSVFTVKSEFRDKDNYDKIHKVGDDVSKFDDDRLNDLVSRGLVTQS